MYFAESDVASFDRTSYLLFKPDAAASPSPKDLLTMNFKTLHNSGVLMHTDGHHGHTLTLELLKGKLFVRLRKGSHTLTMELLSVNLLSCLNLPWNVPGDRSGLSAILMALRHSCLVCVFYARGKAFKHCQRSRLALYHLECHLRVRAV